MNDSNFDPATGEVLDAPPVRGEFQQGDRPGRALDGNPIPAAAYNLGDLINMIEDGGLQAEAHAALAALVHKMGEVSAMQGKASGTFTLKMKFSKEHGEPIRIASDFTVTEPKLPRPKSIMWSDEEGNFTRFPPNQMQMFGLKQVGGSGGVRNV